MRKLTGALWLVTGCFNVNAPSEVPCASNGACPAAQFCDFARSPPTCIESLPDVTGGQPDAAVSPPRDSQPGTDAPSGLVPWSTPVPVLTTPGLGDDVTLTADMLELYFTRNTDIYAIKRATLAAPWSAAAIVSQLSTISKETTPELSPDGLTVYFASNRPGSQDVDIWVSTRATRVAPWSPPVLAAGLNSVEVERSATPTMDPDLIVLASDREGDNHDLFVSERTGGVWWTPIAIGGTNTLSADSAPFLSSDALVIYFLSDRHGNQDLYQATRVAPNAVFTNATPIAELNTNGDEADPWVSPDGRHLFFVREHAIYEAKR